MGGEYHIAPGVAIQVTHLSQVSGSIADHVNQPSTRSAFVMTLDYTVRSPLRHVLRAYDRAIHACEQMDAPAANRAIALLRESHEGESAESLGFDGIFVWCNRALAAGDFAGAARRLSSLRNAWATLAKLPGAGGSRASVPHLQLVVGNA